MVIKSGTGPAQTTVDWPFYRLDPNPGLYEFGKMALGVLFMTYKKLQEDKENSIKAVKDSGLGLMKAVKAANKKK